MKVNSSGYLPRRDGEADHCVAYTLQIPKKISSYLSLYREMSEFGLLAHDFVSLAAPW